MESQIKWLQQNVQDRDELLQAIQDQINVPETQIPMETEENISKKSDCNVPLINTVHNNNNPSPPFSEFENQKGKLSRKERKEVRQIMRKVERIEKEQQEIDKRNAERKVQKDSYKFFCITDLFAGFRRTSWMVTNHCIVVQCNGPIVYDIWRKRIVVFNQFQGKYQEKNKATNFQNDS